MEGIVNGMDTTDWSPNVDKFLDVKYDADTVDEGKALAKETLQAELGLPVSCCSHTSAIAIIGRHRTACVEQCLTRHKWTQATSAAAVMCTISASTEASEANLLCCINVLIVEIAQTLSLGFLLLCDVAASDCTFVPAKTPLFNLAFTAHTPYQHKS